MEDSLYYNEIVSSFFSKWKKQLDGSNYVVEFDLKSILHNNESMKKEVILARLMGLSNIIDIEFNITNENEMRSNVSKLLKTGGFDTAPAHFTKELIKEIDSKMLPKYYEHLKHYINLGSSKIYKLSNVPDAPCFDIFWSYSYLINDQNRGASIIVGGEHQTNA